MKCSCCGQEISSSDRFCQNCGENNEGYVEVVVNREETTTPTYGSQPINRVPINKEPYPNNQNPNNNQGNGSPIFVYNQMQTPPTTYPVEGKAIGICALIFSILGGWLGLVLALVGLAVYKTPESRRLCKISLWIIVAWFALGFIIGLSML